MKKVKKNKRLSHPSNFTLGLDEASTMGVEVEGRTPKDLAGIVQLGTHEASKMEERGLATVVEAQAEVSKAQALVVKTLRLVTKVAVKAKGAVFKVKWVVALVVDASEDREVGPSTAQESAPTFSEVRLLGMEGCLRLLEDSVPPEIKEEVQGRPLSKGL